MNSPHDDARECPATKGSDYQDSADLLAENARLRAEVAQLRHVVETNDLCHNLHGKVDARAFADGCAQEQRRIYGCAPDADALAALRTQEPLNKLRDRVHRKMQDDADTQDDVHPCEVWSIALRWIDEAIVEGAGLRLVAFSESRLPHDDREQAEAAAPSVTDAEIEAWRRRAVENQGDHSRAWHSHDMDDRGRP